MNWKLVDQNENMFLWEGTMQNGIKLRLPSPEPVEPSDFFLDHHQERYGELPPKIELGKRRGYRIMMPGETSWREYGWHH